MTKLMGTALNSNTLALWHILTAYRRPAGSGCHHLLTIGLLRPKRLQPRRRLADGECPLDEQALYAADG